MDELIGYSFDLGEIGGGRQVVVSSKQLNEKQSFVFTVGNGPKYFEDAEPAQNPVSKNSGRQLFNSILSHIPGVNKPQAAQEENRTLVRCFRLTYENGNIYKFEEVVDAQKVIEVAQFMGYGPQEPEMSL